MKKVLQGINRNVLLLAVIFILATIFYVWLTIYNNKGIRETSQLVSHGHIVIKKISEAQFLLTESESALKAYMASGDPNWKLQLTNTQHDIEKKIAEIASMTLNNPHQLRNVEVLKSFMTEKIKFQEEIIRSPVISYDQARSISYNGRGTLIVNAIKNVFAAMIGEEDRLLTERVNAQQTSNTKDLYTTIAGSLIMIIIILVSLVKINKENKLRLQAEAEMRKRESRYRGLIEDSSMVMFTADLNGNFNYVSNKCLQLTGFTNEELNGKHFTGLINKEWVEDVAEKYYNQFKKNVHETVLEFPIVTKDGYEKWVEQTAVIIYEDHFPAGFQCTVKDITDRKEAEFRLEKSEELIQMVLNNTREGFFMLGKEYQVMLLNKKAKDDIELMTGKKILIGMDFLSVVSVEERERVMENFERVFNGEMMEIETKFESPYGIIWTKVSYSPVKESDVIVGAAVVTHDITQNKLAEQKIKDADNKIRALMMNSVEGFFMLSRDHRLTMINEAGRTFIRNMTGRDCKEGDDMSEYIVPERKEIFKSIVAKVLLGEHKETETTLKGVNGERRVHNYYYPVFSELNEIIGVCVSTKDITDQNDKTPASEIRKGGNYLYKAG